MNPSATMTHRVVLVAFIAMLCCAITGCGGENPVPGPNPAPGGTYPHNLVTLVTHSTAGGGSDVFLRDLARHLGPRMGVDFVVENVRGGGGARAMTRLATAEADGSVFYASTPSFIFTSLLSSPAHTYADLDPIVNVFFDQEVVYTRTESPFETLAEVIDRARSGRGRWGAATPGSLERQALERLKQVAGVDAAIVSHEGGGDLILNVLNGTLDIGVGEAQEIRSQLEAERLRLLAVFSDERLPELPELPTARESGYDVVVRKFRGLMGPPNTPPEIVEIWDDAIREVLQSPEYRAAYSAQMLSPGYMPQAEYRDFIQMFATDTEAFLRESGVID